MINYSIVMRGNPSDQSIAKKAYAAAQYSDIMDINEFAEHIASHGCVYGRADIMGILVMAVDCIRELLLKGYKIQLGELGSFYVSLQSTGAESASDFSSANITRVKVNWSCGDLFKNLLDDAEFNLVATRAATRALVSALKKGETSVDLTATSSSSSGSEDDDTDSGDTSTEDSGSTGESDF